MITFKLIRKIGKILRGGAGRKEIMLGTICGVLIGFNPEFSLTLVFAFIVTLLLNANLSFVLLGAALGKVASLFLAPVSFHTGFFIIHHMGLEGLFRSLCNAPITALMDLNVYALIGSLPYALAIGIILGWALGTAVLRLRKKMLEADQHEIIGKTFGNRFSRMLLRLAFGKSKLKLDEEVIVKSKWMRKSGFIVMIVVVAIGAGLEYYLFDTIARKSLESSISSITGAEVNVAKAHFSVSEGKIGIEGLQVTDPDKPTHNMVQIDTLVADLDISELLSRNYAIDLLAGSRLKRDVPRESPGTVYQKIKEPEEIKREEEGLPGKSLEDYFAQAKKWKKYADKAYEYLKERKANTESVSQGRLPEADKAAALADAKALGYLHASADLFADRPAWVIHKIEIDQVNLGGDMPEQILTASEISSHPELNGEESVILLEAMDAIDPTLQLVLRFYDPSALHAISLNLSDISIGEAVETSESFPIDISEGAADIKLAGRFSADELDLPFTLMLHNLKASVEEGEEVLGMDAATATEVLSSMEKLEIDGALAGSLLSPRVTIDKEKLTANMKDALVAAGKKELAKRADAEMDKAKEELSKKAGEEIGKALGGEEGESVQDQAKDALKKLF